MYKTNLRFWWAPLSGGYVRFVNKLYATMADLEATTDPCYFPRLLLNMDFTHPQLAPLLIGMTCQLMLDRFSFLRSLSP